MKEVYYYYYQKPVPPGLNYEGSLVLLCEISEFFF